MRINQYALPLVVIAPLTFIGCGLEEGAGGAGLQGMDVGAVDFTKVTGIDGVNLICDFTSDDLSLNDKGGRSGTWEAWGDDTEGGVYTLKALKQPECGAIAATGCMHFAGSGWTTDGAATGVSFTDYVGSIDVSMSNYGGILLAAKGTPPFRFVVPTAETYPTQSSGACVPTSDKESTNDCGDSYGVLINVKPEWKYFAIPFSALRQDGYGQPVPFNLKSLMGLEVSVGGRLNFDLFITNISFYENPPEE